MNQPTRRTMLRARLAALGILALVGISRLLARAQQERPTMVFNV